MKYNKMTIMAASLVFFAVEGNIAKAAECPSANDVKKAVAPLIAKSTSGNFNYSSGTTFSGSFSTNSTNTSLSVDSPSFLNDGRCKYYLINKGQYDGAAMINKVNGAAPSSVKNCPSSSDVKKVVSPLVAKNTSGDFKGGSGVSFSGTFEANKTNTSLTVEAPQLKGTNCKYYLDNNKTPDGAAIVPLQ